MQTITFEKRVFSDWRRDDGRIKKTVTEPAMFLEVRQLVNKGWELRIYANEHMRMIKLIKS
jgi:hypothetical protein